MIDPATKKEWLQSLHAKHERATMAPYWILGAIILGLGLALFSARVLAEPMFQAQGNGVTVTIHKENCAIKEVAEGKAATWETDGKIFHGCAQLVQELGVFVFYFVEDRSLAVVPAGAFRRVVNA
jgi:hypothetical protein